MIKLRRLIARHQLLVLLCLMSVLIHLVLIRWLTDHLPAPEPIEAAWRGAPLHARLTRPTQPLAAASATKALTTANAATAASLPAPPAEPAAPPPAPVTAPAPAPENAPAPVANDSAPRSTSAAPAMARALREESLTGELPGRYQVRLPLAASIDYDRTRALAGMAEEAAGSSSLSWSLSNGRYQLRLTRRSANLLAQSWVLESEGQIGDNGMAPVRGAEQRPGLPPFVTRFDETTHKIGFSESERIYPLLDGAQDRLSLMLQLSGLAATDSLLPKSDMAIVVAGRDSAAILKFHLVGVEQLDCAFGKFPVWHLAQTQMAGGERLDLWLAPAFAWLPLQIRTTGADASVITETASSAPVVTLARH